MTKYLGIKFRIMPDADGRSYLTAVIWYAKSRKELGYFYPAIRLWW
jgi:hypothetical protein